MIPSLPGVGFSGKPTTTGWTLGRTAKAWTVLMQRLGYPRWFAQGGDLGASVTAELAALKATATIGLAGVHLTTALFTPTDEEVRATTPEERTMLEGSGYHWRVLSAYSQEVSTRPQTIGYSLTDSPDWRPGSTRCSRTSEFPLEDPLTVPVGLSVMPGEYVRRSRRRANVATRTSSTSVRSPAVATSHCWNSRNSSSRRSGRRSVTSDGPTRSSA